MDVKLIEKTIRQLRDNIHALERAAFEIDGTIEADVSECTIESTSSADTCIIEMRWNKQLLNELNQIKNH